MTIYLVMQQQEMPGYFPALGKSGIALFNLTNINSDSDLTRQILSELRNGISEKRFTSSSLFPNGQEFRGMVIIYNSSKAPLPDHNDQRLTTSEFHMKHNKSQQNSILKDYKTNNFRGL